MAKSEEDQKKWLTKIHHLAKTSKGFYNVFDALIELGEAQGRFENIKIGSEVYNEGLKFYPSGRLENSTRGAS